MHDTFIGMLYRKNWVPSHGSGQNTKGRSVLLSKILQSPHEFKKGRMEGNYTRKKEGKTKQGRKEHKIKQRRKEGNYTRKEESKEELKQGRKEGRKEKRTN